MDALTKEYPGRTVQLRNYNALCSIYNKRTTLCHIWNRTQINILNNRIKILVIWIGTVKFQLCF